MTKPHPYTYFLNGANPSTDSLARKALEDAKDSGLAPEILETAQVRLFAGSGNILKDRLGFAKINGNNIVQSYRLIEFPYFDAKGAIARYEYKPFPPVQFKNEAKPRKYLQAKGRAPTPYILPDTWAAKDKNNRPLWITEGVKKVLKLMQHGRAAIGLSGVWNFKAGKDREGSDNAVLWEDLEGFRWTGRTVYLAFDSDLWVNPMVRHALYELSFTLYARGAVLRFPLWEGAKGIDDYLVQHKEPDGVIAGLENSAKDLGALLCTDHRSEILGALHRMAGLPKVAERALIAVIARKLGLKAKDLQSDLANQRHAELKRTVDNSLYPYFINEAGGVCRWRRERDGNEAQVELSNFTARITEDVTIDTGLEVSRRFMIEGGTKEAAFPVIGVRTTEFLNLNWVVNHWGNDAIIRAGQTTKDCLREFIQLYSRHRGVARRKVYGHTGWRQIGGEWCYLMANGALGGEGVDVELPADFLESGRYCLPLKPEHEKEAISAVFEFFLRISNINITAPALAYVFLSPLTTLLEPMPSFAMYCHGEKDTFKTALAVLMLAFFGSHTKAGLSNFDSTGNAIMQRAAILKDTLMVVDDYYPSPRLKEAQQKESIAQRIIRDVGNRTGRGRLNPDSTSKPIPTPKGMIYITGEELPALQSTLSRLVTLELNHGDIDPEHLLTAQEHTHLFPHAMASFILWLRDRADLIRESFGPEFQKLRQRAVIESKSRKIPEHVAYLQFAWQTMIAWANEKGVPPGESAAELGWNAFIRIAAKHAQRVDQEDPVKAYFDIIGELLTQGKLRMDHKNTGYNDCFGGKTGELIGYYDDDFYYFLPEALRHAVVAWLRLSGDHFPFSKNTLYDVLQRRGIIETRGNKRVFTQRVGGRSQCVLKMRRKEADIFRDTGYGETAGEEEVQSKSNDGASD